MKQKPNSRRERYSTKSILRLPDLEHAKAAVLNSLNSADAKRGIVTPSMSSLTPLTGIAQNRAWPSTGSWSCVIALISNPVNSPPEPSICVLGPCADSPTKQPTAVFSAPILAAGIRRVKGVKKLWHSPRQLVNGRARQCALASTRSSATQRETRPGFARIATRVRIEEA